jgi:hypothetical protein
MTAARTNNGSKMKTNKEFESTIMTSSSALWYPAERYRSRDAAAV